MISTGGNIIKTNLKTLCKVALFSTYFRIISKREDNIAATCKICTTATIIRGSMRNPMNFVSHLKVWNSSFVRKIREFSIEISEIMTIFLSMQELHDEHYKVYTNIERRNRGIHRITVSFRANMNWIHMNNSDFTICFCRTHKLKSNKIVKRLR